MMEVKSWTCACLPRPAFASSTNNCSGSFAISRHTLSLHHIMLHSTTGLPRQYTTTIERDAKGYATPFHAIFNAIALQCLELAIRHPAFTPLMSC
jgi:hypothetical protein